MKLRTGSRNHNFLGPRRNSLRKGNLSFLDFNDMEAVV